MTFVPVVEVMVGIVAVAIALAAVIRVSLRAYFQEKAKHLRGLLTLDKHQQEADEKE